MQRKDIFKLQRTEGQSGRVGIPLLMWVAGAPLTLVLVVWLLFFRG